MNHIDKLYNKSDDLKAKFTKVSLLQEQNFLQESIKYHLDQQDEVDKLSIALYGTDTEEKPEQQVLKLDKNCQACNGSINFTKNAFKIACLKYVPSDILVEGVVQSRQQLLEKRE